MRFTDALDLYLVDMQSAGRINSPRTVVSYRAALLLLAEDVHNSDPRYIGRDQVKATLRRFPNPNTQRLRRAIYVSFFDWMVEEGMRAHNPARQTRRPKRRPSQVYRLTFDEAQRLLRAARGTRERRAIFLGVCAGLRNQELRGVQGRHLARPGFVWVSPDIAKGGRGRFIPVVSDLEPVVAEMQEHLEADDYALPAQRFRDPGHNTRKRDYAKHPSSAQALYYLVKRVGKAAGIAAELHPHLLRHAFADHIARMTGDVRKAQAMLGHANVGTTESYLDAVPLDDLARAVEGVSFGVLDERMFQGVAEQPAIPLEAPTGIEPVIQSDQVPERDGDTERSTPSNKENDS